MIKTKFSHDRCGGTLYVLQKGNSAICIIYVLIGLFLTPCLIGIPLVWWGFKYMGNKYYYVKCSKCNINVKISDIEYADMISQKLRKPLKI